MKHPFRVAVEGGASDKDLKKLFSKDAVLYASILSKPVHGIEQTIAVVSTAVKVAGPIEYTLEVGDSRQTFLFWEGNAGGNKLMACTIVVDGEDGLIGEMRVVMRAWPITTIFRNAMYKELAGVIPADYWELDPARVIKEEERVFSPIALQKIPLAPDFELHSPMLARSVKGRENVELALQMAHSIQTRSSYTSVIATPALVIELFDCDAQGNPLEGIWVSRLDQQGQIYDLTVYLRPYTSVTVLRNAARKLAETEPRFAFMGKDYWELPAPKIN